MIPFCVSAQENSSVVSSTVPLQGKTSNPFPSSDAGAFSVSSRNPSSSRIVANGAVSENFQRGQLFEKTNLVTDQSGTVPPAWAQGAFNPITSTALAPFAANLFSGRFAGTYTESLNNEYVITPGDRIVLRIWGARSFDDVLVVDQQGNIFIPEVGPVKVGGMQHGNLLSSVKSAIQKVYTDNVESYVNLQTSQPVGIFVTGFVNFPGRYAGGATDSILTFIDRAGGINAERGSYRQIEVKRNNRVIATFDLYNFALSGVLPPLRLRDGDVILVKNRGLTVAAYGMLREQANYEFSGSSSASGKQLIAMATPLPQASHVSVIGVRNRTPFNIYLSLEEFSSFQLQNGDVVEFVSDRRGDSIMVSVSGAISGASRYPIKRSLKLRDLLAQVKVDPNLAATDSIYIRRLSVARDQQAILRDSLNRLEQSALTATSSTPEEATLRVQEAKLIQDFVKRAQKLEADGVLVVSRDGIVNDVWLEDGDQIIIPQKSNIVQVTGEVTMPKAVTYEPNLSIDDYLASAGGVTPRANEKQILLVKRNGQVMLAKNSNVMPGDRLLVLPKVENKNLLLAKDLMQIIYQIAVATKIALDI
jgi:protein involved in polysaccharide export with SLBB domain